LRILLNFRRLFTFVAASVVTGFCFVAADAWVRDGWQHFRVPRHVLASAALYAAFGALGGAAATALVAAERRLTAATTVRFHISETRVRIVFYAVVAGLSSVSTALWTFSGEKAKRSALALWAPLVFVLLIAAAAAVIAGLTLWANAGLARGSRRRAALVAAACLAIGSALILVDLRVFVALYSRLHTLLEVTAWLLIALAFTYGIGAAWQRANWARWAVTGFAVASLYWLGMVAIRGWTRYWLDEALRHVWLEPAYVGRMLQRLQHADAFLSNPSAYEGIQVSRLAKLKERFEITNVTQSAVWDQPYREPPELRDAIRALRAGAADYNVLVYYVDTLRQDVSADRVVMPSVAKFATQSLQFPNAYTPGSDTIRALPALSGGSYDHDNEQPGDLVRLARRAGMESVLVISQSAREFLGKLLPSFRFDQTVVISDYAPQKQVWGYGADSPTAEPIVDRTLEWLRTNRDNRFFLWLFNFDVHAWRELDEGYVKHVAQRYGIDEQGPLAWRYRAVARAVDAQFARLLAGLEELGLDKKTIVLFVSDHGEALGRDGFWVHSIFLWETLIRVPLLIRVPEIAPHTVTANVSLVDVAPTLARYMLPDPDMSHYHGDDLLGFVVPRPAKRRLPILTQATSQQAPVRIGIVDPDEPYKLVLSFESGLPELYDLRNPDPDGVNIADQQRARTSRLLRTLVRSPVLPRSTSTLPP
jgi:hypothetical protein